MTSFKEILVKTSTNYILIYLQHLQTKDTLNIINIYAPVILADKQSCRDTIRDLATELPMENVILAGDTNLTLRQDEKRGGYTVKDPARQWVEDLIHHWDLLDIKPVKGKYTWVNRRAGSGHTAARLDHFLIQSSFLLLGLKISSFIIPSSVSNNKPIRLEMTPLLNLGPIPFRFSPLWVQQSDFFGIVEDAWKPLVNGSPFFV